jgi:hypothetical protein
MRGFVQLNPDYYGPEDERDLFEKINKLSYITINTPDLEQVNPPMTNYTLSSFGSYEEYNSFIELLYKEEPKPKKEKKNIFKWLLRKIYL